MKSFKWFTVILVLSVFVSQIATSEELATKEECIQKCGEVAAIIKEKGADEAIKLVNDNSGPFVWKDTYVYIMDLEATIVAHGPQPKFIGKNLMGLKDPVSKQPWYPALFEKIKAGTNSGWFDYHWKKPNAEGVYTKNCYFEQAGDLVVFAGIYGDKVK
ncbi:putative Cache, type 2 domain protein [Desulfamplus magnetovallimortis]|uniref:Putative Cache, type 2 domain protein n=1 Tax=Desulfamplus magnetovallimortis TaxID=1246637 RepID=A0A1W1HFN0_9BACT|nr:cache domain-containing protein [Desulfamplus magnetovallimortis]SLM31277.1 putative Cache, type 2 domain protein [Desulfamplus magnetovallimortis]